MTNDAPEPTASPAPASEQKPVGQSSMRSLFPGYYPPTDGDLKTFLNDGLIVLDSNALLHVYRFTEQARTEYLDALRLLKDRLWIPHRVGQEFHENRARVIHACATANETLAATLDQQPFNDARTLIQGFAVYRGLSEAETNTIIQIVDAAANQIRDRLNEIYDFGIDPNADPSTDPLLAQIDTLLDGKIGPAFNEKETIRAHAEAQRRIEAKIPPGYKDASKGERSVGDYLVWAQTIEEAKRRNQPVLMINNEQKEDWVRKDLGRACGPRPELVKEIRDKAGQTFHLVNVQMFLVYAREYLSAYVSDSTVDEAAPIHPTDPADLDDLSDSSEILRRTLKGRSGLEAQHAANSFAADFAKFNTGTFAADFAKLAALSPTARIAADFAKFDLPSPTAKIAADFAKLAGLNPTAKIGADFARLAGLNLTAKIAADFVNLAEVGPTERRAIQMTGGSVKNSGEAVDDAGADDVNEPDSPAED